MGSVLGRLMAPIPPIWKERDVTAVAWVDNMPTSRTLRVPYATQPFLAHKVRLWDCAVSVYDTLPSLPSALFPVASGPRSRLPVLLLPAPSSPTR